MKQLLALAAFCLPALAQTPPCIAVNDGPGNTPTLATSTPAPKPLALQVTPAATTLVQAARIFTGNTSGATMALELWSHDAATNHPGTRLAGGHWTSSSTDGWQGCNFDASVQLTANTPYWLLWRDPGSSTMPTATSGTAVEARGSVFGQWLFLPPHVAMMRLYCTPLDDQNVTAIGTACAAAAGTLGTLFTNESPTLGNAAFRFEGSGFAVGSVAFFVFGNLSTWPSILIQVPGANPACWQHTSGLVATSFTVTGGGPANSPAPAGYVSFSFPIPADPGLAGLYIDSQIAAIDPGSQFALPIVTSNGLGVTLF